MRRVTAFALALSAAFSLCLPTPALSQRLAGWYGLSIHSGFAVGDKLHFVDREPWPVESILGIPYFGAGLSYFITDNIGCGIDLAYIGFPNTDVGYSITAGSPSWYSWKYGVHFKYTIYPFSSTGTYLKLGLWQARLKGDSESSGGGKRRMQTPYTPEWELGIGVMKVSPSNTTLYAEIAYSQLLTQGVHVRVDGKPSDWTYPSDLRLYKVRIGLMIPFGGRQDEP